ncbi:hypothetical protein L2E82_38607 [Cichorium intybus]|uniref:Uncharacterized protein n=1 Tax=Cichorium intybus TaxID=13427 RepID=A0ACB9AKJ9_CICIN|nr:hypothetical protein L2E82_38607 [Cichorium intybus]
MAEPNAIVSYDQPFDNDLQAVERFLMCENDTFSPLSFTELLRQNNVPVTTTRFQSTVVDPEIPQPSDPFFDPLIFGDEMLQEGFQTHPSHTSNETNIGNNNTTDGTNDFGNPIQLSTWPLEMPPYTCSCCHILREIIHTNGVDITKLEVHGRLGLICHAVLDKYHIDVTTNQAHEYKMFEVKQFFMDYCKERKAGGYVLLQDPLSSFYEAVCVGLDWEDNRDADHDLPDDSGDHQTNQDAETSRAINKMALSVQRERTGKLTMKDLVDYFHIPIEVAAKKIQIRSIERKISTRAKCLTSVNAEERMNAQAEMDTLRQEITNIYAGFNV